jgi:hypothetical protein
MPLLDELVLTHLADRIFEPDRLKSLLIELAERAERGQGSRLSDLKSLNAEKRKTEKGIARLYEAVERGIADLDDDTLRHRISALRHRKDELIRLISNAERQKAAPFNLLSTKKINAFASVMRDRLQNGDIAFRKAYLRLFVDRIEVDDEEVRIFGPKSALSRGASDPDQLTTGLVPTLNLRADIPRGNSTGRPVKT